MPEYRLYYFDGGHISGVTVIVAVSDHAAEMQAARRVARGKAELWRGARKLRTFDSDP